MQKDKTSIPIYKEKDFFTTRAKKILALNKEITPIMNDLHKVDHSERFWLRLLNLHLKSCIGQKPFLEKDKTRPRVALNTINSFSLITSKQIIVDYLIYLGRSFKYRKNINHLIEKIKDNTIICIGSRGEKISKYKGGVFIDSYYPLRELLAPDLNSRKRLRAIALSLPDIFIRNVLLSMPRFYVEYFNILYNTIPVQDASEKSFHYEHLGGEFMNYVLAKYQEAGSKVIAYQTGGFMGEIKNHPDETSYFVIDELRTYGWKINKKDIPDKAYRLEEYSQAWRNFRTSQPEYEILVVFTTKNEITKSHYDDFVKYFFQHLDNSKYSNLLARPRPISKHTNNSQEAQKLGIPNNIKIDDGRKSMAETAAKAKLVVQTWIPATNFLECLAVDQPVVAVNTNSRPSILFQNHLDDLYRLGILHKDIQSLVQYLNNLDSVELWWRKIMTEVAYKKFKEMFCGV